MKRILQNMCMLLLILITATYSYSQQKEEKDFGIKGPIFTTFTTTNTGSNAIPDNKVLALLKDSNGKLWIGTDEGLAVLLADGETWENYTKSDGLVSNAIKALIEDIDGNIWIGTSNGISKYDGTTFTSYESLPNKDVRSFAMETNGTLWVGTIGGVAYLDGNYWQTLYGLPSSSGYDVLAASDGTMWIAGANGLSVYDGTNIVTYTTENGLPNNYTTALAEDSNGNIWIGTGWSGLVKYDGTNFATYSETEGLVGDGVKDVKVDENDVIWIATSRGVSKHNGTSFTNYTKTEGLANNTVNTILVKTPTSLLFGTDNGIADFTNNTWETLNTADGLIDNYLLAIHGNPQGLMAFGTYTGGASIFNGTTWTEVSTNNEKLPGNWVKSVLVEENGNVWFATSQGAVLFNGAEYILYNNTNGLPDYDIENLTQDLDGNIWFATSKGISKFNGTTFTNYSEGNGLISKFAKKIFANKNDIWIGTSSGISVFSEGVFTNYTTADGLLKNIVNSFEFDDEYVWIASDDGLTKFDGTNFVNYTTTEGLPEGKVKTVTYDANSVLWIGLSPDWSDGGGIAYLEGDQWVLYNTSNSDIVSNRIEGVFAAADADLWIYTIEGASRLSQELVVQEPLVTTTTVTNITQTTATSGGNVTDDGGADVTARGVCWSTAENPTITDSKTENGKGTGEFTSNLTGLTANTKYYVRAYATNSEGTGYGNEVEFTTYSENAIEDVEGNLYNTVTIGNQLWMAENLRAIKYADGTNIPTGLSVSDWNTTTNGAYAVYPHSEVDGLNSEEDVINAYGLLYNWFVVSNEKGVCPTGWKVPSIEEWNELLDFLINEGYSNGNSVTTNGAGNALKSCRQIDSPLGGECATSEHPRWDYYAEQYGVNAFGFNGLPAGSRMHTGEYLNVGKGGRFWTSNEDNINHYNAVRRDLGYGHGRLSDGSITKTMGISIRCIKVSEVQVVVPTVTTTTVTSITQNTATSGGNVTNDGGADVTARGICWSTSENPTITNSKTDNGTGVGEFTSELTGLTASTNYFVRAYATNSEGTGYGDQVEFTTEEDAVTALPFTDGFEDGISSWTIRNDDGDGYSWETAADTPHSGVHHLKIHYNSSGNNDWLISPLMSFPAEESINLSLWARSYGSGLRESFDVKIITNNGQQIDNIAHEVDVPDTYKEYTYDLSNYADQDVKVAIVCISVDKFYLYVDDFSCSVVEPTTETPTVTTTAITNITLTTATSGGNITDNGGADVTTRGVCWSTAENPTITDSKTENGTGTGEFTSNLTGLTANTKYYVRAYATNSEGTGYGQQVSFTTLEEYTGETVTDADGNVYPIVEIGTQKWMGKNLKTTKYNDGTAIDYPAADNSTWENNSTGAYAWYNNDEANKPTYGGLYNWHAVETGKVCPTGWRAPTDEDWTQLVEELGGNSTAGGKLKITGTDFWFTPNTGATNESNFSALGGGLRSNNGAFVFLKDFGFYWSSLPPSSNKVKTYNCSSNNGELNSENYSLNHGVSIRCIKDATVSEPPVTTTAITNITQTTATSGGNVTNDGGAEVTARGVCWSTSENPTIADNKTENSSGVGEFTSSITGLTANTKYYVRAYATNSAGTGYGEQVSFTTLENAESALPLPFADSFEGDISGWSVRDDDGDDFTWALSTEDPRTGAKHLRVLFNSAGNNDWLISPLLSLPAGEPIKLSFWAKSYSTTYLESFDVKVITNDGSQVDAISSETSVPNAYTEYTYNISSYAGMEVNIAIVCVSVDKHYLFVDDFSCEVGAAVVIPTLTTLDVTNITQTTASSGGTITSDGGGEITAKGVVWSTSENPTIDSNSGNTSNGSGTAEFTSELTGLTASTSYFVRAYATNSGGTGYGEQKTFTTTATGVEFETLSSLKVYPNPFSTYLQFSSEKAIESIVVMNVSGQVVLAKFLASGTQLTLNTEPLETGLYIIKVTEVGGNQVHFRVVKR